MLRHQPLLVPVRVTRIPDVVHVRDKQPGFAEWLAAGEAVATAALLVIEYLRSRLRGYPRLLVPDLLPSAPRVYRDGFWDGLFPWPVSTRAASPQLAGPPPVAAIMSLPGAPDTAASALADVLDALRATPAWQRFDAAAAALDPDATTQLKSLRADFRAATKEERIEEVTGGNAMASRNLREAEAQACYELATGAARSYLLAFRAVDEVIGAIAALLSHRLYEGAIVELDLVTADWGAHDHSLRDVRFAARSDEWVERSRLFRLPSSIDTLDGIVIPRGYTMYLDEERLTAYGLLLVGSSSVLPMI